MKCIPECKLSQRIQSPDCLLYFSRFYWNPEGSLVCVGTNNKEGELCLPFIPGNAQSQLMGLGELVHGVARSVWCYSSSVFEYRIAVFGGNCELILERVEGRLFSVPYCIGNSNPTLSHRLSVCLFACLLAFLLAF